MITEDQYKAKLKQLGMLLQDNVLYVDHFGTVWRRNDIMRWSEKGFSTRYTNLHSSIIFFRMRVANEIYKRYILQKNDN